MCLYHVLLDQSPVPLPPMERKDEVVPSSNLRPPLFFLQETDVGATIFFSREFPTLTLRDPLATFTYAK